MNKGKILAFFGAIITIFGFLFFTSYQTSPTTYVYGLGGIIDGFQYDIFRAILFFAIIPVVMIIFLLVGIEVRILGIIGGLWFFLGAIYGGSPLYDNLNSDVVYLIFSGLFGGYRDLIPGVFPIFTQILNISLSYWIYGLGGLIALIGGFLNKDDD